MNHVKNKPSSQILQVIGKNKISSIPKLIATYLKLPNPELYSGHCFRRTSSVLRTNAKAGVTGNLIYFL